MSEITAPSTSTSTSSAIVNRMGTLLRVVGILGVLVFGVQSIGLVSSGMVSLSAVVGLLPRTNLIGLLTVAMLFGVFHAYTYAVIGTAAPTSGADYVLASRVLSAPIAFAASWTFTIFGAWVAGSYLTYIPQSVIPSFMQAIGVITKNNNLLEFGRYSASVTGTITIGTICLVIAFILSILPARFVMRILQAGFFLALLAWILVYFVFSTTPGNVFPESWNRIMGVGSYEAQINLANSFGLSTPVNNMGGAVFPGLFLGFWIFYGYNFSTYFAGEVKRPGRSLIWGSISALILCWAVFSAALFLIQRLVPPDWLTAESFLYLARANQPIMPWVTFYAAILKPNTLILGIIMIAWVFAIINMLQASFFYFSRIMVAWSKDDLMPKAVGRINPNVRSPIVSVLLVAIFAQFGLMDTIRGGMIKSQLSYMFCVICMQIIPVFAVVLFPYIKKEWYEASDSFVKMKLFKIPVITLVGSVTMIYLVLAGYSSFSLPSISGFTKSGSITFLLIFFLSGLGWYIIRTQYIKRKGRHIGDVFKELPQE